MVTEDSRSKMKKCERQGKRDVCRAQHDGSIRKRPAVCERDCGKTVYSELGIIAACLTAVQGLFLLIKQIVFSCTEETLFSRSMVTLLSMMAIFAIMLFYCRRKHIGFSVFPKKFGIAYVVATVAAVAFYVVTVFFLSAFTKQNFFMLFYGSAVTPVFEELLFRGAIWNRMNKYFDKEWKTGLTVTVLFALWHVGYAVGLFLWGGGSLLNIIMMKVLVGAVFGVVTCALRYKTKNCYLGILVHGVLNALG